MNTQQKLDNFWKEYIAVGKEVLEAGKRIGYGMSLVEVKFAEGMPTVLIRSITQNEKYTSNKDATSAILQEVENSISTGFDGARTFTIVLHAGQINKLLLDEYANRRLI